MFPSNAPTSSSLLHENTEHQYLFDDVSLSPTIDHGDTFLPYDQDHLLSPHRPLFPPSSTNGTPFLTPDLLPTPATTKDMPLFSPTHNFFPTNAPSSSLPASNGNILARKRLSKKDRHSKIFTRQGPRDRRMRLSLEIAREFFQLQDMLGFDKASKTIGWLLMNSRAKIKELSRSLSQPNGSSSGGRTKSGSSMSECEDISGIDDAIDNVGLLEREEEDDKGAIKAKKIRQSRKAAFDPLAKVSRVMKRAKARERAKEKVNSRRLCGSKQCPGMCPNYVNQSKSLVTIKGGPESSLPGKRDDKSSLELMAKFKEPASQALDHQVTLQHVVAESLPVITQSGQLLFEYYHHMPQGMHSDVHFPSYQNNDMIKSFSESWNMDDARAHSGYCAVHNMHSSAGNAHDLTIPLFKSASTDDHLQSQFTDVHFCPKSWDAYTNQSCVNNF